MVEKDFWKNTYRSSPQQQKKKQKMANNGPSAA